MILWLLLAAPAAALGQQSEIQRALVQRDQMTAEFAAQVRDSAGVRELQALHARQLAETQLPLSGDPAVAQQLLPYQRARMDEERRVLQFAPPVARVTGSPPARGRLPQPSLALPGGARRGVDPVAPDGLGR